MCCCEVVSTPLRRPTLTIFQDGPACAQLFGTRSRDWHFSPISHVGTPVPFLERVSGRSTEHGETLQTCLTQTSGPQKQVCTLHLTVRNPFLSLLPALRPASFVSTRALLAGAERAGLMQDRRLDRANLSPSVAMKP